MARASKGGKTERKKTDASSTDGPHQYLYLARDTEEDRMVTTLMLAGEALASPLRQEIFAPLPGCNEYARAVGREPAALTEDFTDLLDVVRRIRDWTVREGGRSA